MSCSRTVGAAERQVPEANPIGAGQPSAHDTDAKFAKLSMPPVRVARHDAAWPSDDETAQLMDDPQQKEHALPFTIKHSIGDWVTCVILLAIGSYVNKQPPFEQYIGSRLNDPSISYPHTLSEKQQVTSGHLIILAFWLPLVAIFTLQAFFPRGGVHEANQAILGLLTSLALAFTLTCIVKINVGRLRPDFLARCVPLSGHCSKSGPHVVEGRKSFPSGHTSLSFAGLGYLSIYIAAKLFHMHRCRSAGSLWKVLAAGGPWVLALWVGLTRIADYWHHWEDVLVGGLIGNATAYAMYRLRYPAVNVGSDPHVAALGCTRSEADVV